MRNFDYMKLADGMWDGEVLSYIAKIHECKGRQELFIRQKPVELERLVEIARIQSTEASNKIEGIVTTATRIRQLMDDKTTPKSRDEKEIIGYRDVLNTIHESHDYIPIRPAYILQLHRDLLKHAGLSYGGQFKNTQNYINETKADGTVVTRFVPMAPYETEPAMEAICESYRQMLAMEVIDPLILIPAFICDFLCIHPFNDGNGRMSRLLTLLLLYRNGYEVGKYISIEKQIEKTKDAYYDVLERIDEGWHEEKNDTTPFIKYMLQVILACYTEFEARVGLVSESSRSTVYDVVKTYVMEKVGKFTGAEVVAACPSGSRSAVLGALKRLTEEGLIVKCGTGRGTFYVRSNAIEP
ncbi:MAG TPA: Fic family protein [Candidatus Merdisoma merdipullorum]|nr:Fic family protein [Candidatus Merdisoma merdipullorum]